MSEQQIKQRIQYLVEHGGLYPREEIMTARQARRIRALIACLFIMQAINLIVDIAR